VSTTLSDKAQKSKAVYKSVQEIAKAKRLDPEWLRDQLGLEDAKGGGIFIPYFDAAGNELFKRERGTANCFGKKRFHQPKGTELQTYGLQRLYLAQRENHVYLCCGESDAWALWDAGLPALSFPGDNGVSAIHRPDLDLIEDIYLVSDNDETGRKVPEAMAMHLGKLGWPGRLWAVPVPESFKDVSEWRAADPEKFRHELSEAVGQKTAVPITQAKGCQSNGNVPSEPEAWEDPVSLDELPPAPALPVDHVFSDWMTLYIKAEATATQTPPDLAAMLLLAECGAALAGKFRVQIRDGWSEPTNLYTVTALQSGEPKSAVFKDTMAPTYEYEAERRAEMAPITSARKAEHAVLEAREKHLAGKAAKEDNKVERDLLLHETKEAAKELAQHVVPEEPELICDDVTPEKVAQLLVRQGGKMFQAAPEGTPFEIVKGRYSDTANFDVYLKGHAGDPLRSGRVSREREAVDDPALSVALPVQPDVIAGLAADATLKQRGFLARFLYSIPASLVGKRTIAPHAVSEDIARDFRTNVLALWKTCGAVDDQGKPVPHWLRFSVEADGVMRQFERWLEPLLAPGEELSMLAGWANKLAGAIARIAGILHVTRAIGEGESWDVPIDRHTVEEAIRLGRDYLLPHAKVAFGLMGADEKLEQARHVWANLCRASAYSAHSAYAPLSVSRRDIHNQNRRQFVSAKEIDPVLTILMERGYLRSIPGTGETGRGHSSPKFHINPLALGKFQKGDPRTHCAHCAHSPEADREPGEDG
jgi:hypothetical protein